MRFQSLYGKKYVYDPATNRISRDDGACVEKTARGTAPLVLPPFDRTLIEEIFQERRLRSLTLVLTERCNLRCRYCVYSGAFAERRRHSNRTLSEENGRKILDWFAKYSAAEPKVTLGFYGGEVLLELATLKSLTEYAEKTLGDRLSHVDFTTNGAALTSEARAWIRANDKVRVSVTLNGPAEIHDAARVFANGEPTFDVVEENVRRLAEALGDDFPARVAFLANYSNWLERLEMLYFFQTHPIFSICDVLTLKIQQPRGTVREQAEVEREKERGERATCRALAAQKLDFNAIDGDRDALRNLHNRAIGNVASFAFPGLCVPFKSRLLVDLDGYLRLCESTDSLFALGNALTDEIYFDKLEEASQSLRRLFNDELKCGTCSARQFCRFCYQDFFDGDVIAPSDRIQRNCVAEIDAFRKNLSVYLSLAERRPEALKDLTVDNAASPQLEAAVIRALKRQFDAISKNER